MNKCYLSLGSNQKCPERQIRQGLKAIKDLPSTAITQVSTLHWTKAWGVSNQPDFCNVVVEIITRLSPERLLSCCQKIEANQGRVRKKRWGPRTLDVDIILYATRRIKTNKLVIPHAHMHVRDFVLIPLSELLNSKNHHHSHPH